MRDQIRLQDAPEHLRRELRYAPVREDAGDSHPAIDAIEAGDGAIDEFGEGSRPSRVTGKSHHLRTSLSALRRAIFEPRHLPCEQHAAPSSPGETPGARTTASTRPAAEPDHSTPTIHLSPSPPTPPTRRR